MEDNRKKEQERDELHRSIWSIADDLRGSVDGWDFKSYVLGTMFYRFISEKLTTYINNGEWNAGYRDFDYAKLSDEEAKDARLDFYQLMRLDSSFHPLNCSKMSKNEQLMMII